MVLWWFVIFMCVFNYIRLDGFNILVSTDVILFFKCLPFAPILGIVYYFGGNKEGWFARVILKDLLGLFVYDGHRNYAGTSKATQWFDEKLHKHTGFILESLLEAFPNAILQVYFCVHIYYCFRIQYYNIFLFLYLRNIYLDDRDSFVFKG